MPLLGRAVLAIWNGIANGADDEFVAWHVREHIPERVGLPGFLRGRRFVALDGAPKYFNFYETESADALHSPAYLARLNAPSEWTRKVVATFTDTSRTVCDVEWSFGIGEGGFIETVVLDAAGDAREISERLHQQMKKAYEANHGIVGAHLLRGQTDASRRDTAETRLRSAPDKTVPWVLLVEASTAEALFRFRREAAQLGQGGAVVARGIYQIQFTLAKWPGLPRIG